MTYLPEYVDHDRLIAAAHHARATIDDLRDRTLHRDYPPGTVYAGHPEDGLMADLDLLATFTEARVVAEQHEPGNDRIIAIRLSRLVDAIDRGDNGLALAHARMLVDRLNDTLSSG